MNIFELAEEYSRVRSIAYGISVADYLLLKEHSDGVSPTAVRKDDNPSYAVTKEKPAPAVKQATTVKREDATSTRSALDILKSLGE